MSKTRARTFSAIRPAYWICQLSPATGCQQPGQGTGAGSDVCAVVASTPQPGSTTSRPAMIVTSRIGLIVRTPAPDARPGTSGRLNRMSDPDPPAKTPARPRLVVATEGRPIMPEVIARAVELAPAEGADVLVIAIARVWGTSLGFPNPWLLPSKREWDAQREIAGKAVRALQKAGLGAQAYVVGTRRPGKRIVREAAAFGAVAIVMGADPSRGLLGDFSWSQEPHRVVRRSKRIPVHLVLDQRSGQRRRPDR